MGKRIFTLLFFTLITRHLLLSQAGEWTWMSGADTTGYTGSFGTMGVTASTNAPPALYEPAQWTDQQGNFWFFGGVDNSYSVHAALWKYVPSTNNWTWMKGSQFANANGIYGSRGVPAPANYPRARGWGVPTWVDLNGDLWLYGGSANALSDMWRYNIASNEWTWMQGPNINNAAPVYGTQQVAAAANTPGGRLECSATWVDNNGNLWLFGGLNNMGCLNDLWMYNISTNQWAWMNGYNGVNGAGVYGAKGVPAAANCPPSRTAYSSWTDRKGNFWLFGGGDPAGTGSYSDMWKYNPTTNMWAWMSGDSGVNSRGNYGTACSASTTYCPIARSEGRARWTSPCGNFWLFGGGNLFDFPETYSDLWEFNPATLQWMLVNGNNTNSVTPVFGTMGVASAANTPGGRCGSLSWIDSSGNLYLFAGTVNGFLNAFGDLWKFTPDSACSFQTGTATINLGADTAYCSAFSQVLSTGADSTIWSTGAVGPQITVTSPGIYWATANTICGTATDTIVILTDSARVLVTPPTSIICSTDSVQLCATSNFTTYSWNTGQTTPCIYTSQAGNYYVTVTDANHCSAQSNHVSVSVYPSSPISISVNGDTLSVYNVVSCQWYLNGVPINGATSPVYIATIPGNYTVSVDDKYGCTVFSNPVTIAGINNINTENIIIYPNPSSAGWNFTCGSNLLGSLVELYDAGGRLVYRTILQTPTTLIAPDIAKGVYLLKLNTANNAAVFKLVRF